MNGQGVEAIVKNSRKPEIVQPPGGQSHVALPQSDGSYTLATVPVKDPEPQPLAEEAREMRERVQHDSLMFVVAEASGPRFTFGRFIPVEEFVIGLQSYFLAVGDDRSKVLQVVGNIKEEIVKQSTDDGISQAVIGRKGVALGEELTLPNPVKLTPYRTFVEIDQPSSLFVLRAQQGPTLALIEADGGAWKLEAIRRIVAYLEAAELGVDVIA